MANQRAEIVLVCFHLNLTLSSRPCLLASWLYRSCPYSIQHDAWSITGSNLRNILLKTDKASIQDLVPNDVLNIEYHPIQEDENWKVSFIQELIEAKNSNLEVVDFTDDELDKIMEFLCVMWSSPLSFSPFPPSYVSMGFARGPPPVPIIKSGAIQINYLISFCTRKWWLKYKFITMYKYIFLKQNLLLRQ